MSGLSILAMGMVLGLQHATDADHLAAVAALATRQGTWKQTLRQGVAWGIGHALTLALIGGFILSIGRTIPENISRMLESAVGVMLLLLGADVLRRLWRGCETPAIAPLPPERRHFRAHAQGGAIGFRLHSHETAHWSLRALLVGMVHGMAGSAALTMLVLQSAPTLWLGMAYILVFGAGSIAGMALLSLLIALPLRVTARGLSRAHAALTLAVGLLSCWIGVSILLE